MSDTTWPPESDELLEEGRLVEAGWVSLRETLIGDGPRPSSDMIAGMRAVFFAASGYILRNLVEADDPRQLAGQIDRELDRFQRELIQRVRKGKH